ncbi:MAG: hypothetical protein HY040_21655 [Planctomycetes bacterium]|nr:hypothetical protein [Planctomycetota bacterium]
MIAYEKKLDRDLAWALREGSMHFEKESAVHTTLLKITTRLTELEIPYAVVGGMAMFFHGYRRFTEDVDILVTPEGLKLIHEKLGYLPPFAGSKHLRDEEFGVRVEFLVTGRYPGDGQLKPIAIPDPGQVSTEIQGISFLNLPTLVEMKLVSGMTGAGRLKDLGDVEQMIQILRIPEDFAKKLHPYVRDRFAERWHNVRQMPEDSD